MYTGKVCLKLLVVRGDTTNYGDFCTLKKELRNPIDNQRDDRRMILFLGFNKYKRRFNMDINMELTNMEVLPTTKLATSW